MSTELEIYIKKLLDKRGINDQDKEDLYYEIKDHLMLLKNEYLSKGLSEDEAVKLSIKDFGNINFIGNDIKRNLPSNNKYENLSFREKTICLLEMFLSYFIFICIYAMAGNISTQSIFFDIGMATVVTLTSFIYINKKLNSEKGKVKNLIICNILFFIIEKIIMLIFTIFTLNIIGLSTDPLLYTITSSYVFDLTYILAFVLLVFSSVIVTKYIGNMLFKNIRNTYNYTLASTVLFVTSIILLLIYYLIPNRFYLLRKIIINTIGTEIISVSKNVFFMVINNGFVIPNIGLLLLMLLCIKLVLHIKKKGIKSIL
ncbi:hypothetical protein Curi_c23410 [Gottschalkia acidurici 9a]|uniref:Uncharacterized protein n=1 Tax=Gottschalkia acidurici (strain ATCC 7906 / DSM 604 / BCRC 14475 / CIP 104303 / KCTC 5404 / NCIMB 10678 / 9a) TaxID=1128398 RepID=K0AZX1_GOTA9|nr:permease prefix domain 1-containing protein [Gottschalkia acidurici]AFS79343.1 hypothetical protein Curi_c23410 [Gottschalkia acidurici 9a]